ncbi:MAG: dTDP-4-dehydrorhamnose reductase [Blastomonas sp.]
MAERCWLLTGGSGQVGHAFSGLAMPQGVTLIAPDRAALDLADLPDLDALIGERNIAAIINCGAYTAVDRAESEEALALAINGEAPGRLAAAAARADIPVVHVSTDYVFDGRLDRPYHEDDPVAPQNAYGRTKLAGEQAVAASGARHVILRTAWVVSDHGSNFVKTMLRLGEERDSLAVVSDQHGSPSAAADIAAAIATITVRLETDRDAPQGVFHFTNSGEATWHQLADFVFDRASRHGRRRPVVAAIPTSEYPTPASRPANSRLDCSRIAGEYGIKPRPWQDAVGEIVDALCTVNQQEGLRA